MKAKKYLAVFIAAALSLGACSLTAQDSKKTTDGDGTVTVLTHDSFALSDEAVAEFEETSGYKLKTISAGDGTVLNNLRLKKDAPVVDAFFGVDSFNAHEVLTENLAEEVELDAKLLAKLPASAQLDGKLVAIDRGDVCLNYDKAWFAEKQLAVPTSFEDLKAPEYQGLTVLIDPLTSTPGFAFLAATVEKYGDQWKEYWKDILANGAKVVDGWSTAYYVDYSAGEGAGAFPIVLSYSSSPAYHEGGTAAVFETCIEQVEYAGVTAGAKNADGAKAFIEFMLSDKVQTEIPNTMYMYPIVQGIEMPKEWAEYAPLPENSLQPDLAAVATNRETWLKDWEKIQRGE
ncbi:MAG: thiamine ABC transporter substrate-binding protein [Arcanobacterium sp.]|nr:thiamine ABC transporter substrate-binding protein [Arcanobacterium sp.]